MFGRVAKCVLKVQRNVDLVNVDWNCPTRVSLFLALCVWLTTTRFGYRNSCPVSVRVALSSAPDCSGELCTKRQRTIFFRGSQNGNEAQRCSDRSLRKTKPFAKVDDDNVERVNRHYNNLDDSDFGGSECLHVFMLFSEISEICLRLIFLRLISIRWLLSHEAETISTCYENILTNTTSFDPPEDVHHLSIFVLCLHNFLAQGLCMHFASLCSVRV